MSAYLKGCVHSTSREHAALLDYAQTAGIPLNPTAGGPNPHAWSAFYRHQALKDELSALAARSAAGGLHHLRVASFHGFQRECRDFDSGFRIAEHLEARRAAKTSGMPLLSPLPWSLELQAVGFAPMRADARVRAPALILEPGNPAHMFDFVWICDAYEDELGALTPERVRLLCDHARDGRVTALWRSFEGVAGWDTPTLPDEPVEGTWVRLGNGKIAFKPDHRNAEYKPHADVQWIHQSHHACGLAVRVEKQIGPYCLVTMMKTAPGNPTEPRPPRAQVEVYEGNALRPFDLLRPRLLLAKLEARWEGATTWVANDLVTKVADMAARAHTQGAGAVAVNRIFLAYAEEPGLVALADRNARVKDRIIAGSVAAVLFRERAMFSYSLNVGRTDTAAAEATGVVARGATAYVADTPLRNAATAAAAVIGLAGAYMLARKVFGARAPASLHSVFDGERAYTLFGAPYWEEIARSILGRASPVLGLTEFAHKLSRGVPWQAALVPLTLHLSNDAIQHLARGTRWAHIAGVFCLVRHQLHNREVLIAHGLESASMPLWLSGLVIYLLWAYATWTGPPAPRRVDEFRAARDAQEPYWPANGVVEYISPAPWPSTPSRLPAGRNPPDFTVAVDDVPMTPAQALAVLPEVQRATLFPLLVTNGLLHQPSNGPRELLICLLHRVYEDPFVGAPLETVRHARWAAIARFLLRETTCFAAVVDAGPRWSFEAAFRALRPARAALVRAAYAAWIQGTAPVAKRSFFVKTNETLALKDCSGVYGLRPRAICNLPPEMLSLTLAAARDYSDALHEVFDGQWRNVAGVGLRIYYAAGAGPAKLAEIGEALTGTENVLVVSGDDSLFYGPKAPWMVDARAPYLEADFSKMDRTEDAGPMECYAVPLMRACGLSQDAMSWLVASKKAPMDYIKRYPSCVLRLSGRPPVQQATGSADTTASNSATNIGVYVHAFRRRLSFSAAAAELGMRVTQASHGELGAATFLKGWWQPDSAGVVAWYPLPSQLLKLGKMLNDPAVVFKGPDSTRRAAAAVAAGLAVPADYPILGAFLAAMRRGRDVSHHDAAAAAVCFENPYRLVGGGNADREQVLRHVCTRYDLTREDVERVEGLFARVLTLPAYVEDSVFAALAAVDYA